MVALIPGTGYAGAPPGIDTGQGTDPLGINSFMSGLGGLGAAGTTPTTTLPVNPGLGGLMQGLSGIQAPGAVQGPQYQGGISGAQGVPGPAGISGANSGIARLLGQLLPAPGDYGQLDTLGAMLRGGGVVR